jgi:hypothetical protein
MFEVRRKLKTSRYGVLTSHLGSLNSAKRWRTLLEAKQRICRWSVF